MVPETKREWSSESEVVWMEESREGDVVLRPGCETRPRRGFESSGMMRVFAYESPSSAPHEGHDSPSASSSCVQEGHLIARRILSPVSQGRSTSRLTHSHTKSPGGRFTAGALFSSRLRARARALTSAARGCRHRR